MPDPKRVTDRRWWMKDLSDEERARRIVGVASELWKDAESDRDQMWRNARLYGNMPILGLTPQLYRKRAPQGKWNRLSLNVVKAVCDAFVAQVTDDRPKATFATSGATWQVHRKAELLEKFVDGINYEAGIYDLAPLLELDACIFGRGVVKPYADLSDKKEPRVALDRVFPWEILVDQAEAFYGKPRTFFQVKFIDRLALQEEYPDVDGLDKVTSNGFEMGAGNVERNAYAADIIVVVESWRVPRSKNSGDGMHCIAIGDKILHQKPYARGTLPPVEFLFRQRPAMGVDGESLASELAGLQLEINILLDKIKRSMHLLAVGHWLVENGSDIISNQLNNAIGSIIRYKGTMPTFISPDAVSVQVFQHLDRLYQRAFEIVGISQQMAQAQKPAGLNSGKAQLVYAQVQNKRQQPSYRIYQSFFMRLARQEIAVAREIADDFPQFATRAEGGRAMVTAVKWGDANLDDDEFIVKIKPTNALADDPAALTEAVTDMTGGGLMSPDEGKRLLASCPDLEEYFREFNASYDLTMQMLEGIVDSGGKKFMAPEPFMNLAQSLDIAQKFYLRQRLKGAPDKGVLEPLRRWIARCNYLLKKQQPPAPAQAPAPPAPMGMAPPQPAPAPPGSPVLPLPRAA